MVELTPRMAILLRLGPQFDTLSNSMPGTIAATSLNPLTPDSAIASGDRAAMLLGPLFRLSERFVAVTMISPSASCASPGLLSVVAGGGALDGSAAGWISDCAKSSAMLTRE